jgi:hypothetical protein
MTSSAISRALRGLVALLPGFVLAPLQAAAHPTQGVEPSLPLLAALAYIVPAGEKPLAPVLFHDARLADLVADLEESSPTAAAMLLSIRRSGYPLVFGTFHDFADEMRQEYGTWDPARKRTVGYMAPIVRAVDGPWAPLSTVKMLVAVNLVRLEELFAEGRTAVPESVVSWDEIERLETLSVLAHEIVHAYGLAVSGGDPHLGCPDPQQGERPDVACVVIGENLVRREIGAPLDWGYGLASMSILASRYAHAEAHRARLREIAMNPFRPLPDHTAPARRPALTPPPRLSGAP